MISGFLIKQGVKIAKKELDKRGGAEQVVNNIADKVKSEIDKHSGKRNENDD
jgi:hypothetical protein